jgi:hypothetical protein
MQTLFKSKTTCPPKDYANDEKKKTEYMEWLYGKSGRTNTASVYKKGMQVRGFFVHS